MKIDVSSEIGFKTFRSGGAGGQNVNKVETAVEGNFHLESSVLLSEQQKEQLRKTVAGKINSEGYIQVRSQVYRTQLENKKEVITKMNRLLEEGLKKPKKRIATKPSKAAKEKRLQEKKNLSLHKQNRKKPRANDF
ncbi:MAG TPA: alternative ribosome rescue aminoacyl-tRNA hydrolase ArfB [Flavitalea sp.]|nr:alternative ribosome rescue aminoacyl-tRNA hydrolase ArfB [Flavitalea sp.]